MKSTIRILFFLVSVLYCSGITAQLKNYSVENAHSHNDYLNATPFYRAFNNGFGSIEADVFAVNGVLCVAHSKQEIKPQLTLKNLYISPLLHEMETSGKTSLNLLIDIKESYVVTLALLQKELERLKQYLSTLESPNLVTIIITGNRPPPTGYKDYPEYLFFDDDLKLKHNNKEWERVGLVSLQFSKISQWKGDKKISRKDKKRLTHIIDSVHSAGKPIRFWAAPDNKKSWSMQMKLHADFIGTDKIDELANCLRRLKKDTALKR